MRPALSRVQAARYKEEYSAGLKWAGNRSQSQIYSMSSNAFRILA